METRDAYEPVITDEIAKFLDRQRLGFVATVGPDGKPNVSPKGTISRWTCSSLIFADIRSPDTIRNLQSNNNVEISVIDPILRRGYLFKGTGMKMSEPATIEKAMTFYKKMGIKSPINAVVLVRVSAISSVHSPLYDLGMTEEEIGAKWRARLKVNI